MSGRLKQETRQLWAVLCLATKKFSQIDGDQRAAAFAYYAFFSLFPLVILFITIASIFIDREQAGREVIDYVESYLPLSRSMESYIFGTIAGVVKARGQVGFIAFLILVWGALQFFKGLLHAVDRAWGVELHNWWRLPLKSLTLLGVLVGAVLFGIGVPVLAKMAEPQFFLLHGSFIGVYEIERFFLPLLVLFLSLSLLYRLAPRRRTRFAEVWIAALYATLLMRLSESLFVIYMKNFAKFNVIYGAFGGIMALLLWIYLSGYIFIFCACLCAARSQILGPAARK